MGQSPGDLAFGQFRLVERLGSGGFGTVWRARDEYLGIDVALKEMHAPSGSAEERAVRMERARREARAGIALGRHPHLVTVRHSMVDATSTVWIVMDLVTGRSLQALMAERGPLPEHEVLRIGLEMTDALATLHGARILHRDVKPGNIMIREDGSAVLVDLGNVLSGGDPRITRDGIVGTAYYLAPERLRDGGSTAASDVYSLGATLYHALEGRAPFDQVGDGPVVLAVLDGDVVTGSSASTLSAVIGRMLEPDVERRIGVDEVRRLLTAQRPLPQPSPRTAPLVHHEPSSPEADGRWWDHRESRPRDKRERRFTTGQVAVAAAVAAVPWLLLMVFGAVPWLVVLTVVLTAVWLAVCVSEITRHRDEGVAPRRLRLDATGIQVDNFQVPWGRVRHLELTDTGVLRLAPLGREWLKSLEERGRAWEKDRDRKLAGLDERIRRAKLVKPEKAAQKRAAAANLRTLLQRRRQVAARSLPPPRIDKAGFVELCSLDDYPDAHAVDVLPELENYFDKDRVHWIRT